MCWNKGRLCWKIAELFYFCQSWSGRKLLDPTTYVPRECCVLSGRGLCDELITRPEESYRLWRVVVCDVETSRKRRPQCHMEDKYCVEILTVFCVHLCFSVRTPSCSECRMKSVVIKQWEGIFAAVSIVVSIFADENLYVNAIVIEVLPSFFRENSR